MLDEQIISVDEFRKLTKKQGFASDTFSDDEIRDYIYLLDSIAELGLKEARKAFIRDLGEFQKKPETTTQLEQQV
jgi:hypothetical protein